MRGKLLLVFITGITIVAVAATVRADVPTLISYQGVLLDSEGDPVTEAVNVTFTIYDSPSDGSIIWQEEQLVEFNEDGRFEISLGEVTPITDDVFDDPVRWLGVQVEGDTELEPRTRVVSVAYAHRISTVDGATGGVVSGDVTIQSDLSVDGDIWSTGKATIGAGNTNTGSNTFVAGASNTASGNNSTIAGGYGNSLSNTYVSIGGGEGNTASDDWTTISGGRYNTTNILYATVGGGYLNTVDGSQGTISGGQENIASGTASTISGGTFNKARGHFSVIGGGGGGTEPDSNSAPGNYSTVGGGSMNRAGAEFCTISGGKNNLTVHEYATVGGGENNRAHWQHTTVGGGKDNVAGDWYSVVAGGLADSAHGQYNTIGGGQFNTTNGLSSTIGGGMLNIATSHYSVVGGGRQNIVYGQFSAIPGGFDNTITSTGNYSYLFGIGGNLTQDSTFMVDMPHIRFGDEADGYEFPAADGDIGQVLTTDGAGSLNWDYIEGGNWSVDNSVLYTDSFWGIARGEAENALLGYNLHTMVNLGVACTTQAAYSNYGHSTVSGGYGNAARGNYSTVSGGRGNIASAIDGTVGGGGGNIASGGSSTIAGGVVNTASGQYSTICGGIYNINEGEHSVIPGGGWDTLTTNAEMAMAFGGGVYVDNPWRVVFFDAEFPGRLGLNRDDRNGGVNWPIHVGTDASNGHGAYLTFTGIWASTSSREYKENFRPFDSEVLLGRIADLDIETWQYIGSDEKHVGPYAEEFNEAFGTGAVREDGTLDTKSIAGNDVAGVALAGVKALLERIEQLEARITELEAERR